MFQDVSDAVVPLLKAKGLDRYLAKIWVYKQTCLVLAFTYKGIKFAFDLTPSEGRLVSIDLVQKRSRSGVRVTATGKGKERIAQELPLEQGSRAPPC